MLCNRKYHSTKTTDGDVWGLLNKRSDTNPHSTQETQCETFAQCDTFIQCEAFTQYETFSHCEAFTQYETFSQYEDFVSSIHHQSVSEALGSW